MQATVEKTDGLGRKVQLEIPAARIDDSLKERMHKLRGQIRLNGFRPGKVPLSVIANRFGESLREEIIGDLIQENLGKVIEENSLRPVRIDNVDRDGGKAGEDLTVTTEFEVFPEIELTGLESIKIDRTVADVSDADIDEALDKLRRSRAEFVDVQHAAVKGDRVMIDFVGTKDGEPFAGGTGENMPVDLGEGGFVKDFDDALHGVTHGEQKSFDVTFPDDYGSEELAGQTVQFAVTVNKVQQPRLPELDDEFVESVGIKEGGVEALRKAMADNLKNQAEQQLAADLKDQVLDGLYNSTPLNELPTVLVKSEQERLVAEAHQGHDHAAGESCDAEVDEAGMEQEARKRVALGLLVAEVARKREIEADANRVNQRLMNMIGMHPQAFEMFQQYRQDQRIMQNLQTMVLEEQVIESLLETADVTETSKPFKELMAAG